MKSTRPLTIKLEAPDLDPIFDRFEEKLIMKYRDLGMPASMQECAKRLQACFPNIYTDLSCSIGYMHGKQWTEYSAYREDDEHYRAETPGEAVNKLMVAAGITRVEMFLRCMEFDK